MNKYILLFLPLIVGSGILFLYTTNNITAINWKIATDWKSEITGYIPGSRIGKGKKLYFIQSF